MYSDAKITKQGGRLSSVSSFVRSWEGDKKEVAIFVTFLVSACLLRAESFLQVVLDWDEGLYLLMGRAFLEGDAPYTVIWDRKPPGLFLLFALVQFIFGESILGIRIVSWLAVTVTAYVLYRIGRIVGDGRATGLLAGIFYLVFSLNSQGLAAHADLFFTPLVVLAFWILLRWQEGSGLWGNRTGQLFALGLLMGLAFEIKYVVIFELAAIFLLVGIREFRQAADQGRKVFVERVIANYTLLTIGFLLPFALVSLYYWRSGHFDVYLQSNFAANMAYEQNGFSIVQFLESLRYQVSRNTLLWLSVLLSPIYLYLFRHEMAAGERGRVQLVFVWFVLTFPAVMITRLFYSHYYLQLMPPMCLLGAWLIMKVLGIAAEWRDRRNYLLVLGLVVIGPLFLAAAPSLGRAATYATMRAVGGDEYWGDDTARIAAYLSERVTAADYVYAVDTAPTIYYLVPARIPTRFPFALHLMDESYANIIGTDQQAELARIMDKKPTYLIKQYEGDGPYYDVIDEHLARDYELDWTVNGIKLYVRRDDPS